MQVVWQKTRFWTNYSLHCIQVYSIVNHTSRSVKNKAANVGKRRAEYSRRRPSPFFAQDKDELFVTGSTLYAGDGFQTPLRTQPDTTPLVITTFSAAVGHRKTEPGKYFCRKLTLTRTPDPIRPTRRGPESWPQPTHERQKTRGCLSGEFWSDTAGDNRRQQNRIYTVIEFYALVNLKPQ